MPSEWIAWLLAAAAAVTAWLVGRTAARGMARPMGWGSFGLFTVGACLWMSRPSGARFVGLRRAPVCRVLRLPKKAFTDSGRL